MMNMGNRQGELVELIENRAGRRALAMQSFPLFLTLYFPHFLQYEQPAFHREIITLITDPQPNLTCIVAFRGSAKSTLCSLSIAVVANHLYEPQEICRYRMSKPNQS